MQTIYLVPHTHYDVAWAADSFGMNAQLPQIYRKAGYKWLAFRRGARADIKESEYYCLTWPYRLKDRFPPILYKYKMLDIHKEITAFRDIPRIKFTTTVDNKRIWIQIGGETI